MTSYEQIVDEGQATGVAGGEDRSWPSILALPLTRTRIHYYLFRQCVNEWLTKTARDPEVLKDIIEKQKLPKEVVEFDYWVQAIRAEIPAAETYDVKRRQFDEEVAKARFAIERGTLEGCPQGQPIPDDRWRRALWGTAIRFAEMKATLAQPHPSKEEIEAAKATNQPIKIPPIASVKAIEGPVATSRGMQRMLDEFVARTNIAQRGIGGRRSSPDAAVIQFGPPRSWFFNAQKKNNPQMQRDLINLELESTLWLGDFVDTVFQHEQEHQEKSVVYPSCVETHRRLALEAEEKLKELTKQGKGIKVGKGGVKNFDKGSETEQLVRQKILHNWLYNLKQPVWNAAEDNMCDQGVSNLSIPERKDPVYPYDMAHGINTATILCRGAGNYAAGIAEVDEKPAVKPDGTPDYAAILGKIQTATVFAFYARNGLSVGTSPQDLAKLGIDVSVITDLDHPDYTPEQAYREMRKLCDAIAETQPVPNDLKEMSPARYKAYCAQKCDERNLIIDELFRRFVDPTIEKMKEEFESKNLDEQIEELKKQMQQKGQGQPGQGQPGGGGQGQSEGQGGGGGGEGGIPYEQEDGDGPGEGQEEGEGQGEEKEGDGQGEGQEGEGKGKGKGKGGKSGEIPSDPSLQNGPGQGQDKGVGEQDGNGAKSWGDATRDGAKERPGGEGQGKGAGEGRERGPMKQRSSTPGKSGYGHGGDPLKELALGDGRSWEQLREDPKYQEAVDFVAERLEAISKRFPAVIIRREERSSLLPTEAGSMGDLAGRVDPQALFDLQVATQTGDVSLAHLQTFRDDIEEKIASPGDLFLAIDASGSMGHGAGSRLEAAMKSAAILYDAAKRAGYGVYITVWGNDFPFMITAPGVSDEMTVGQFDTVLGAVLHGRSVPGLHNGTNLDGAIANAFAQVAKERPENTLYENSEEVSDLPKRRRPRGPVHVLFLTDGEVGSQAASIEKALEGKQALTFDAGLTEGASQDMREIMKRIPASAGRGSIVFDIKDTKEIPKQVVKWAEDRYQRVLDQVSAAPDEWKMTQERIEAEAQLAGEIYCHDHKGGLGNRIFDDFRKDVEEQHVRLSGPTTTVQHARSLGRSAQLEPIISTRKTA